MMYHGAGYGGPPPVYMVPNGGPRQYPLELLQAMGGVTREGTPRRDQPRQRRPSNKKDTAFGYESDDSSLSSNASGSNKSSDKGET